MAEVAAERAGTRARLVAPALLLLAVLVFFGDSLLAGRVFAMRDAVCDFVPWREYAAAVLAAGDLPLWNHHSFFGQPFLANPQSAVFYPPHVLFVLPGTVALMLSLALHALAAGVGAYGLARQWSLDRAPALLAATGFAFGTYLVAQMEFLPAFTTVAWSPLTLLFADRMIVGWHGAGGEPAARRAARAARWVVPLAAFLALQALAGHPQALLQCHGLLVLYVGCRALALRDGATAVAAGAGLAVAGLLAMALAAPQLLPMWDLIPHSTRSGAIDPGMAEASVHPRHVFTLLLPFLFGGPGHAGEWWNDAVYEFWAATSYPGIAVVVAASLAPLVLFGTAPRNPRRFAFAYLGTVLVGGMLLAMGERTPLYPLLVEHLPFFDRLRWPGKFLHYPAFAMPLLGGLGLQAVLDATAAPARRRVARACAAWGGLWLVLAAVYLLSGDGAKLFGWLTGGSYPHAAERAALLFAGYRWMLVFLAVAVIGIVLARGGGRAGVALLLVAAFVDVAGVSRRIHPVMDADVYRAPPAWLAEYEATTPRCRVHTIYQQAQVRLYGTRDASLLHWARDASVGEIALRERVHRTWGFGQLRLARAAEAFSLLESVDLDSAKRTRLADVLNVGFVIHGGPFDDSVLRAGRWPEIRFTRQRGVTPRAFIAASWRIAPDRRAALDTLLRADFDPRREAVLHAEAGEDGAPGSPGAASGEPGRVVSLVYRPNRAEVAVEVDRTALLVLSDTWHTGWRAFVDGREVPILHANASFRGVPVEPGTKQIEFRYEEPALRVGFWVLGLGLLALTGLSVFVMRLDGRFG